MNQAHEVNFEKLKKDPLLNTEQTAEELDCAKQTVYQSRSSGKLFGVKAPRFIKKGARVFYRKSTLEKFMSQFQEYENTAQYKIKNRKVSA